MTSQDPGQASTSNDQLEDGERSIALEAFLSGLNWVYDKAVSGVPGTDSVQELVASYLRDSKDPEEAIDELINWQIGKASAAGFASNLGGLITLPVTLPANLAVVLFIQVRMIAAIAMIRGYDIHSDQVRTLCSVCLTGGAAANILKDVGVQIGAKFTKQAIMQIAGSTLVRINQAVGFRLVTKAGTTGIINLTKLVPFVGGIVGGTFDGLTTAAIAASAKNVFAVRLLGEESASN